MKIGIVTMSRDISYGANLQAYALQKNIKKHSEDLCLQIAREPQKHSIYVKVRTYRNILTNINRFFHSKKHKRKMRLFEEFQTSMIDYTDSVYTEDNAAKLNDIFDCFVSGSDQVWNCTNGIDELLFLEFANKDKRKVAYAASIGLLKIPEIYQEAFVNAVSKYDYISVREEKAREIVSDLCNKKCEVVLDPVFLLKSNEWKEMFGDRIIEEKYIYVYATQVTDKLLSAVRQCEKMTGYRVISVHKLANYETVEFTSGPREFLNYIYNAEYIITSSFHCVAFSFIFNKDVTIIPHSVTGVRVTGLMKLLNAEKCLFNGTFCPDSKYDATEVNALIEEYRNKSKNYIQFFVNGGQEND